VEIQNRVNKYNKSIQVLSGDRTGEDKSPTSPYWYMYWANTNLNLRVANVLNSLRLEEMSYLPLFVNYYDYDFRNASAIRLFEDIL